MVEFDVGHDADLRPQPLDRPVRFVALGDQPPLPRAGVPAELRNLASDQEGGIAAEPRKAVRDHPGRRRLAVRPRDDDRAPERDQLGQKLGAGRPGKSYALETKTSQPAGGSGSAEIAMGMPAARTRSA